MVCFIVLPRSNCMQYSSWTFHTKWVFDITKCCITKFCAFGFCGVSRQECSLSSCQTTNSALALPFARSIWKLFHQTSMGFKLSIDRRYAELKRLENFGHTVDQCTYCFEVVAKFFWSELKLGVSLKVNNKCLADNVGMSCLRMHLYMHQKVIFTCLLELLVFWIKWLKPQRTRPFWRV